MRILHTSDWHLGRKFGEHPLLGDQADFLSWFVDFAVDSSSELIVVSGDIYDRSMPPADAVELFGNTLRSLHEAAIPMVAIAGNHDSATRLSALDGITDASGVILRGGYSRAGAVSVIPVGDSELAIVAVPFLDPLLSPAAVEGRLTHEEVLESALSQARGSLSKGMCSLVLAHAFVAGGRVSDSERELTVGTAGMISAKTFDGFDYVALGHLHSPQAVAGEDHLRYSGSPLAYSFSEVDEKSVCLVELSEQGFVSVEAVPIPVGRRVQTVSGLIADLEEGPRSDLWTRVELTDPRTVLDAQRRLRERFPFVVEISRPLLGTASADEALSVAKLRTLEPAKLADEFWLDVTGTNMSADERGLMSNALTPSHKTAP